MHAALLLLTSLLPSLASAFSQFPLLSSPSPSVDSHAGDKLIRLHFPSTQQQRDLQARYDVWSATAEHLDLRVTRDGEGDLIKELGEGNKITTLHEDISTLLHAPSSPSDDDIHATYHNLEATYSLLRLFAADHPPLATLVDIGKSYENRFILGLTVSHPDKKAFEVNKRSKQRKRKEKATFLVVGGQHPREWITSAATLFMAHGLLLDAAQKNPPKRLLQLLEAFDFTFIPTLNPDGYEYAWSHDRLWRKSRQPVGEHCHGIDLNRNFAYHWSADTDYNPCADYFPGNASFQAVETQALRSYIEHGVEHKVIGLLDLHSFGEMLMYPFAYSCGRKPSHEEDLIEAAYNGATAAKTQHGVSFEVGSVCDVSYVSTGQAVDWAYGEAGVKWAYSANLRDSGIHGFLLPPSQIRPAGEETLAMLLAIADFVRLRERR